MDASLQLQRRVKNSRATRSSLSEMHRAVWSPLALNLAVASLCFGRHWLRTPLHIEDKFAELTDCSVANALGNFSLGDHTRV